MYIFTLTMSVYTFMFEHRFCHISSWFSRPYKFGMIMETVMPVRISTGHWSYEYQHSRWLPSIFVNWIRLYRSLNRCVSFYYTIICLCQVWWAFVVSYPSKHTKIKRSPTALLLVRSNPTCKLDEQWMCHELRATDR